MEFSWLFASLYVALFVVNTAFIYSFFHSFSLLFSPASVKTKSEHAMYTAAIGSLDLLFLVWMVQAIVGGKA